MGSTGRRFNGCGRSYRSNRSAASPNSLLTGKITGKFPLPLCSEWAVDTLIDDLTLDREHRGTPLIAGDRLTVAAHRGGDAAVAVMSG
jgi:hypothetical protein